MKHRPTQTSSNEMTMKDLWLASFTSLLCRLSPEEALSEADRALALCNDRWKEPDWVETWQYKHNYPVGTEFDPPLGDTRGPGEA